MARQRPTHSFEPDDPRTWAKGVIPDPERWRRIEEIFHQVLESEPSARSDLLHDICRGDDELRRKSSRCSIPAPPPMTASIR